MIRFSYFLSSSSTKYMVLRLLCSAANHILSTDESCFKVRNYLFETQAGCDRTCTKWKLSLKKRNKNTNERSLSLALNINTPPTYLSLDPPIGYCSTSPPFSLTAQVSMSTKGANTLVWLLSSIIGAHESHIDWLLQHITALLPKCHYVDVN